MDALLRKGYHIAFVGMATSSRSWTSTSPPHFPNVTEEDSHESNFSFGFLFDDVTFCDQANRLLILIGPRAAKTSRFIHRQKETTLLRKSRTLPSVAVMMDPGVCFISRRKTRSSEFLKPIFPKLGHPFQ